MPLTRMLSYILLSSFDLILDQSPTGPTRILKTHAPNELLEIPLSFHRRNCCLHLEIILAIATKHVN
jgi:hypothetical protein